MVEGLFLCTLAYYLFFNLLKLNFMEFVFFDFGTTLNPTNPRFPQRGNLGIYFVWSLFFTIGVLISLQILRHFSNLLH